MHCAIPHRIVMVGVLLRRVMHARAGRSSAGAMRSSCRTAFAVEQVMLCGGRRMCLYELRRGLE
eukprot:11087507-Ditylum_brightwellii.AAC.1